MVFSNTLLKFPKMLRGLNSWSIRTGHQDISTNWFKLISGLMWTTCWYIDLNSRSTRIGKQSTLTIMKKNYCCLEDYGTVVVLYFNRSKFIWPSSWIIQFGHVVHIKPEISLNQFVEMSWCPVLMLQLLRPLNILGNFNKSITSSLKSVCRNVRVLCSDASTVETSQHFGNF
jgi:hypothetical protein